MDYSVDKLAIRKDIQMLQKVISEQPNAFHGDNDSCPLKHSFCDGFYVREIFIPKGTVVVGKIHKHAHPNFLMKGIVSVVTEDGSEIIEAPMAMISKAGTKRAVYAIEDCVWITVHLNPDNTQDLELLEEQIISKDYKSIGMEGDLCHGLSQDLQQQELLSELLQVKEKEATDGSEPQSEQASERPEA